MPRINLKRFLGFLGLTLFLAFWGCGTKSEKDGVGAGDTSATAAQNEDDKLEAIINEAMGRLRYKDKTYIYDMEFTYYREQNTFDKYLQEAKIKTAQADSLEFVDVISVEYFGQDSARAVAAVHFRGPTGQETVLDNQPVVFYRHHGRWIKPTLSNINEQQKYDDIVEKAKAAAKSESEGSGK